MRRLAALIILALTIAGLGPPVAAARAAPSPAYDASGNVVDNGTNLGGFAFTYDFSNQPTAVTIAGAPYPYVYDGDLKRVKHARPGGQTIYTAYSRVSGKPILRYHEPEQSYFDWTEGVGPMEVWFFRGALHSYRHLDAQGSVMADSNAAGGVGFSERYTPFGERLIGTTNHHNPGYTGHVRDGDTGLNYMQARFYDPVIGRFLSTDPIGYQDQLNLYAYVHNDPVNKTDPTGEFAQFAVKFAIDVALEAGIQYATTGSVDVGSAVKDAATGLVNPAKTLERAATLAKVAGKVGDGVAAAGKKGADFVVDSKGTAVRNSAAGARADLEGAGFKGAKTTETAENGTMHTGLAGKDGPMDVRIMDGQASGGDKGPRAVTTRSGTNDLVRSDGSKFRNNESVDQRRAESHIRLGD